MATAISAFRGGVLTDVIGCPPFIVDQAVVNAVITLSKDAIVFQKAFEHSVDADVDVDTSDNDSITIDLTSYISSTLRPYTLIELQIDGAPWLVQELELENDVQDLTNYQIMDTKFFNFPSTTEIKLYPFDTVNDVLVYLKLAFLPIKPMTTVDDVLFNNHQRAIEAHAKWFLLKQPKKAWTDPVLAEYYLSEYSREMEEGKIHRLQGYAFGSLRPKSQRLF